MKKLYYLLIFAVLLLPACTKNQETSDSESENTIVLDDQTQEAMASACIKSGGKFDNSICTCPDETYTVNGTLQPLYKLNEEGICTDVMGTPGGEMGEQIKQQQAELMKENNVDNLMKAAIEGKTIEQGYEYKNESESFTSLNKGNEVFMDKKALAKIYEKEESVSSFYSPENPSNPDVILVSTEGKYIGEWPNGKETNKIYSYNLKTGELILLYEETENRVLRTIGMDGSKLVLMQDEVNNSPGPCFSIWANWKKFGFLELADIKGGLKPYNVPEYQIEKEKIKQKQCQEENGLNQ